MGLLPAPRLNQLVEDLGLLLFSSLFQGTEAQHFGWGPLHARFWGDEGKQLGAGERRAAGWRLGERRQASRSGRRSKGQRGCGCPAAPANVPSGDTRELCAPGLLQLYPGCRRVPRQPSPAGHPGP